MARSDKTEVSPLAVEIGSLFHEWNVRQLEERQLSSHLYCLYFSLCIPIPSCIKWYISMHSSKPLSIVFIPTIPAKDIKKNPVSHYQPNFSIWISFSGSPTLHQARNLSETLVTPRMYLQDPIYLKKKGNAHVISLEVILVSDRSSTLGILLRLKADFGKSWASHRPFRSTSCLPISCFLARSYILI